MTDLIVFARLFSLRGPERMPVGGSTAAEERLARIRASLDASARATSENGVTEAETVAAAAEILIEACLGELVETALFWGVPAT